MTQRRKKTKHLTRWIRLMATDEDLATVHALAHKAGDIGISATVRRIIREEGRREGVLPPVKATRSAAQPAPNGG